MEVETIRAERVYDNQIEWQGCPKCKKKVCDHGLPKQRLTSTVKKVLSDGNYYEVRGWGSKTVEEGQEITGEVTEESYVKDGETRTSKVITLSKPISAIVETVCNEMRYLSQEDKENVLEELRDRFNAKPDNSSEINIEDIPF